MRQASRNLSRQFRIAGQVFAAALREIFDEAAYSRFLTRNQMTSSCQAYAVFRRENELVKARRHKCC
jgi:hypothetical protein